MRGSRRTDGGSKAGRLVCKNLYFYLMDADVHAETEMEVLSAIQQAWATVGTCRSRSRR